MKTMIYDKILQGTYYFHFGGLIELRRKNSEGVYIYTNFTMQFSAACLMQNSNILIAGTEKKQMLALEVNGTENSTKTLTILLNV